MLHVLWEINYQQVAYNCLYRKNTFVVKQRYSYLKPLSKPCSDWFVAGFWTTENQNLYLLVIYFDSGKLLIFCFIATDGQQHSADMLGLKLKNQEVCFIQISSH